MTVIWRVDERIIKAFCHIDRIGKWCGKVIFLGDKKQVWRVVCDKVFIQIIGRLPLPIVASVQIIIIRTLFNIIITSLFIDVLACLMYSSRLSLGAESAQLIRDRASLLNPFSPNLEMSN